MGHAQAGGEQDDRVRSDVAGLGLVSRVRGSSATLGMLSQRLQDTSPTGFIYDCFLWLFFVVLGP